MADIYSLYQRQAQYQYFSENFGILGPDKTMDAETRL
jgi:hypothetical protein